MLGIGDGWLKVDGDTIYEAKDLKVGLFQAADRIRRRLTTGVCRRSRAGRKRISNETCRRHGHGDRLLDRQFDAGGRGLAARGEVRHFSLAGIRPPRLPLPRPRHAAARPFDHARSPRHALPRRRHRLGPRRDGSGDRRFRPRRRTRFRTSAPASSSAPADRRRAPSSKPSETTLREGPEARRPVRRAEGDVVDRIGDALHLVQDQGPQLFDLVGLLDIEPLHRQRRRTHPVRQAGRDVRRRLRGTRLDAVGPVRRHGRDVQPLQRHARTRLPAPTTRTATVSSSPAAPAFSCWRNWSTPRRAARASTPR